MSRIIQTTCLILTTLTLAGCLGTFTSHRFDDQPIDAVTEMLGEPHEQDRISDSSDVYRWTDTFERDRVEPTGSSVVQTSNGLMQVNNSRVVTGIYRCEVTVITEQGRVTSFKYKAKGVGGCKRVYRIIERR